MRPTLLGAPLLVLSVPASHAATPDSVKPIPAADIARLNTSLAEPSEKFDTPARIIKAYVPIYPISRLMSGRAGSCKVGLTIGRDGKATRLEPDPKADRKMCAHALYALRYWTFQPAMKAGDYVETRFSMPFNYSINR